MSKHTANASLIIAAPKLLDGLKYVVNSPSKKKLKDGYIRITMPEANFEFLSAAIAEAEAE